MSEINTTPLVDIMLVLLIIFLITIPVITKNIPVHVPKAVNIPTQTKPENITISVNADGDVYWGQQHVPDMKHAGRTGSSARPSRCRSRRFISEPTPTPITRTSAR